MGTDPVNGRARCILRPGTDPLVHADAAPPEKDTWMGFAILQVQLGAEPEQVAAVGAEGLKRFSALLGLRRGQRALFSLPTPVASQCCEQEEGSGMG